MPADRLNRWVILPAGVIINVCIESNYAWSVWILPGDMPEECKGLRRADPHGSLGHRDCDDADPEHYFGIVHVDLTPTPGYLAYRALTKARPAGSVNQPGELFLADGKLCVISWKRPDGQRAYAIWCPDDSVTKNVLISGELTDAFDCHGSQVKVCDRMTFSQKITYFIFKSAEQGKEPPVRVE